MSTVEALEAHFRRNPHDWSAWLVYGDHLAGQGDARAELIRLEHQHATARLAAADKTQLEADLAGLVKQHQAAWGAGAPEGVRLQWLHGFVVGVELAWTEERAADLAAFLAGPSSRLLHTLAVTRLGDAEDDELDDEEEFDEETGEPVRRFDAAGMKAALEQLLGLDLARLVTLSFAYLGMRDAGVKVLATAKGLTGLEQLDLRYNELKDAGVKALVTAPFLPQLRALHLQGNGLRAAGVKALAAAELPHLSHLDLRFNALQAAGAKALASSKLVSTLTRLELQRSDVGEAGVAALARSTTLPPPLSTLWKGLHASPPPDPVSEDDDDADDE